MQSRADGQTDKDTINVCWFYQVLRLRWKWTFWHAPLPSGGNWRLFFLYDVLEL